MALDPNDMFSMSYGLYVVSASAGGMDAGCIVNTATQVTAEPIQLAVAVNKENVTARVMEQADSFALTVLDETADMPYIGNFGFRVSDMFDKFKAYGKCETELGAPYSPEHVCAVYSCRKVDSFDVGTHLVFVGEVVDTQKLSDEPPMTYTYYHTVLRGKTPPKASSYVAS